MSKPCNELHSHKGNNKQQQIKNKNHVSINKVYTNTNSAKNTNCITYNTRVSLLFLSKLNLLNSSKSKNETTNQAT